MLYIYKNHVIKQHKRKATAKVNIGTKLMKKLKTFPLKHIWTKSLFSVNKRFYSSMYEENFHGISSFALNPSGKKTDWMILYFPLQDPEKVC